MAAPDYSTTALNDIGNGLGYIYVTKPIASAGSPLATEIVDVLDNTLDGVRTAKTLGLQGSSLAANRVSTGIITIDAPTGGGSITSITSFFGVNLINIATPITYTGATTASALAEDIASAINAYYKTADENFTATTIGNVLYLFGSPYTTKQNGSVTITSTGFLTYTEDQIVSGGSDNTNIFDDSFGYQFFLDADYASGGCCSGAGTATVNDISKSYEITNYIVTNGLNGMIPSQTVSMSNDTGLYNRQGALTKIDLRGEGGADDDLNSLVSINPAISDRVIIYSSANDITVYDGTGNIELKTSTHIVSKSSFIELIYLDNGNWVEINRSDQVIGDVADYRAAGYGMFSNEDFATAIVGSGGTINFTPNVDAKWQKLTGVVSIGSNQVYGFAGTPIDGDEFWLEYDASTVVGAFTLTIFGVTLTANQALNGGLIFYSRYLNGAWYTHVLPNLNDGNTYTFQSATEFYKDASVTVQKVETTLKTEVLSRQISFESNEVGDMKMYMGYPGTVEYLWFVVDKDLAATDNGTIVPKNDAGTAMTSGTVTATASSTISTSFTATPTANNTFVAGDILTFTTAKTTKGGKGTLYVKISKS
jgi:hypothetical protein